MAPQQIVAALAVLSLAVGSGNAWAQQRAPSARPKAGSGTSLDVTVTDGKGAPVKDVHVRVTGAVTREAITDESGGVTLAGLKAGSYRLRFDAPGWVSLERDLTVAARTPSMDVNVMLTAAPPPPPPPAPTPAKVAHAEPQRPVGDARVTDVADFADRNLIRNNEPQKQNVFGCTGYSTTRLLQVRDPLENRQLDEADETLYVLAGDGVLSMKGRQDNLTAGVLAVIPRGTTNAITRRSKGPLILISEVSGPPCATGEK